MADKNRSVVFTAPRKVEMIENDVPKPGPGQVLVRTTRTLISTGTELSILNAEYPPDSNWSRYGKLPFNAGYCNVGVVEELGEGVDASWKGRRLASSGRHTAWHTLNPEVALPIPDGVPDEPAAFYVMAQIAQNGVRRSQVAWGEAVVVYGLGILGQLTTRFCYLCGARPIIGVDISANRIGMLPDYPGMESANPKEEDWVEKVKGLTRERMADIVFEITGNPDLIPGELAALKKQGRFVLLSSPRGKTLFDFHDLCNGPSYTIIGAHNGSHPKHETLRNPWTRPRHGEMFFDMIARNELDLAPLISHRAQADQAPELYAMLVADRSQAMGVILEW